MSSVFTRYNDELGYFCWVFLNIFLLFFCWEGGVSSSHLYIFTTWWRNWPQGAPPAVVCSTKVRTYSFFFFFFFFVCLLFCFSDLSLSRQAQKEAGPAIRQGFLSLSFKWCGIVCQRSLQRKTKKRKNKVKLVSASATSCLRDWLFCVFPKSKRKKL